MSLDVDLEELLSDSNQPTDQGFPFVLRILGIAEATLGGHEATSREYGPGNPKVAPILDRGAVDRTL